MKFVSTFEIIHRNRNSKARYVQGVGVGDIIRAETKLLRRSKYAETIELYRKVGNEFVPLVTLSQGELANGYTIHPNDTYAVFLVKQI